MERKYLNLKLFKNQESNYKKLAAEMLAERKTNEIVFANLNKNKAQECIKLIREKCLGEFIDLGTFEIARNKGGEEYFVELNRLTTKKLWRVLQNFIPAITGIEKYKKIYTGDIEDPDVEYKKLEEIQFKHDERQKFVKKLYPEINKEGFEKIKKEVNEFSTKLPVSSDSVYIIRRTDKDPHIDDLVEESVYVNKEQALKHWEIEKYVFISHANSLLLEPYNWHINREEFSLKIINDLDYGRIIEFLIKKIK